jgi:hypothetical protein
MLAAQARAGAAGEQPVAAVPDGLHEVAICALSGEPANPWCPSRTKEWLPDGGDGPPCSWHHQSDDGLLTIYPPEYRAWSGFAAAPLRRDAARVASGGPVPSQRLASSETPIAIANPPDGAVYSVDPTLRREFQAVPLRAVTARPTTVRWRVDGVTVGSASSERPLSWPLVVGTHRVEVEDADGRRASTSLVVR